jgi:hypothetical protein
VLSGVFIAEEVEGVGDKGSGDTTLVDVWTRLEAFVAASTELQKVTISFTMSVYLSTHLSAWNNLPPTGWIFMKFD